jgi:N-carbamoylputrescine amidase
METRGERNVRHGVLRVATCEVPPSLVPGSTEWRRLCDLVGRERPDLVLLPEMPFGAWISSGEAFDAGGWRESLARHEEGLARLGELGVSVVASTRPRELEGRRVNEAFLWTSETGLEPVHTKQYFPDEEGYYEARWFTAGERYFRLASAGAAKVGFLICTELMFNEHARAYGRAGADVVLVPRAVGRSSLARWRVAAQMAAIVSGAWVVSANRSGVDERGQEFGGAGWIIEPSGVPLAETSVSTPVLALDLDLDLAERAKVEYPCYVPELSVRAPAHGA